jgi:membrane protease YdiL (CAAX protease family)
MLLMEDQASRAGPAKPWGAWATIGFGFLILILWIAAQVVAALILGGSTAGKGGGLSQGWIMARGAIVGAPVAMGGALLAARARKGISVSAYLDLAWPTSRQVVRWSLVLVALLVCSDALTLALGRPLEPESVLSAYRSAGSLSVFLFGVIVAAPIGEEFLFRGFLFAGFSASRLGPVGAIAITSLVWGVLHSQYDLYGIASIVVNGVLLGLVRWRARSLWLCVALHGLMNAVATAEAVFMLSRR